MATRQSLQQRLEALVTRLEPRLRDAFLVSIADITNTVLLTQLIAAIEVGNYTAAFEALGMSPAAMRPVTAALEQTFEAFGQMVGDSFPRFRRGVFHFDVRNPRAEDWLREQSSQLVTNIIEDTRVAVRNVLTVNMEAGNNPRTTALDIVGRINPTTGRREGGLVGLSQPQELAVRNARRDLEQLSERYFTRARRDKRFDTVVAKAIADGKPLDKATIDKLISRYKDNLLKWRGETIARTESIASLNRAQYESYKQAIDEGATKASNVKREWDSAGDKRVRHSHAVMDGQTVGLDEAFTTPSGYKLMFPGDNSLGAPADEIINCRCRVKFKTDWLADID